MLLHILAINNVLPPLGIFYVHLVILQSFGNFVVIWYIFPRFVPRKIWQPWYVVASRGNGSGCQYRLEGKKFHHFHHQDEYFGNVSKETIS
jgi:hypothetical protein